MKKLIATIAAFGLLAPAALAASNYVKVSPGTANDPAVVPTSIRVFGATTCKPGSLVTLYSHAFQGGTKKTYRGVPAVYTRVQKTHKFSTHVTIEFITSPAQSTVYARCGARTFAHTTLHTQGY